MTYQLPIEATITTSWASVRGAKKPIWAAIGILFLTSILLTVLQKIATDISPILATIANIIASTINYLFGMGLLYIGIKRAYGLPISYRMMFRAFELPIALRIIGVYLLQILFFSLAGILIAISLALFTSKASLLLAVLFGGLGIAALIYLYIALVLAAGFVLDQGTNSWEAIKLSMAATKGNIMRILLLFLVQTIIFIIAIIPLGIGLIWSIPFMTIQYGFIYKNLKSQLS